MCQLSGSSVKFSLPTAHCVIRSYRNRAAPHAGYLPLAGLGPRKLTKSETPDLVANALALPRTQLLCGLVGIRVWPRAFEVN